MLAAVLNVHATAVADQQQSSFTDGLSARTLPGHAVWQSFTPGFSGVLTTIEVGLFNNMDGDGWLSIYSGEGTHGPLLEMVNVKAKATDGGFVWNVWSVNVPIAADFLYTFSFVPNPLTLPDPYGVALGDNNPYAAGTLGIDDESGTTATDFDMVFRTYVAPIPEPSTAGLLALFTVAYLARRRR